MESDLHFLLNLELVLRWVSQLANENPNLVLLSGTAFLLLPVMMLELQRESGLARLMVLFQVTMLGLVMVTTTGSQSGMTTWLVNVTAGMKEQTTVR